MATIFEQMLITKLLHIQNHRVLDIGSYSYDEYMLALYTSPNLTLDIIERHPEIRWNRGGYLSANPNITWDFIQAHQNYEWDYKFMSMNKNITWEIVEANQDKPWDIIKLFQNPALYPPSFDGSYVLK
jgi:hypothetical protein